MPVFSSLPQSSPVHKPVFGNPGMDQMVQNPLHVPLPTLSAPWSPEPRASLVLAWSPLFTLLHLVAGQELVSPTPTTHPLSDRTSLSKYFLDPQQPDNLSAFLQSMSLNPSSILSQRELSSSPNPSVDLSIYRI